jgi:hypothetical protein
VELERFDKIEINGIDLTLGMNHGSTEVKMSNNVCRCRFRLDESLLVVFKCGLQMA